MTEEEFRTACSQISSGHHSPPFILFSIGTGLYSKDITIGPAMWDEASLEIEASQLITGLDFHLEKGLLYFVAGSVSVADIYQSEGQSVIVSSPRLLNDEKIKKRDSDLILDVSVDWLNDRVYFSVQSASDNSQKIVQQFWYFVFCDLNLAKCQHLELNLTVRPDHVKADPFHGYLYWMERSDIFRTHLTSQNFCPPHNQKELLYSGNKLGPFVISYSQYSLLVPDMYNNEMVEVSLDLQQAPATIHNNYNSKVGWNDILSIIQFPNGFDRFYWSSSVGFNIEFRDNKTESYSYSLIETDIKTTTLKLYHPLAQTEPVPVNPVEALQSYLGPSQALISWQPPVISASEGCAGYREWRYQVEVEDTEGSVVVRRENITTTRLDTGLDSLLPGSLYHIRVRPYSQHGHGPWSLDWAGRTLSRTDIPDLVWTGGGNIHTTNVLGQFHHSISVMEARNIILTSQEELVWTSGGNIVKRDGLGTSQVIKQEGQHVSSLALEPLGQRLYYSLPSLRQIKRITLGGREEISFKTETSISNLVLHSQLTRLCWLSLEISIICSDLEGGNRSILYKVNIWENRRIINIAINEGEDTLYMVVHSNGLYRILERRLNDSREAREVKVLRSKYVSGGLRYLDRKLFLVENSRYIVCVELDSSSQSTLDTKFTVDSLYISAGHNLTLSPSVVPNSVPADSVMFKVVEGETGTVLSWSGVETESELKVTYSVGIQCEGSEELHLDTESPVTLPLDLPSHLQCHVSLQARSVYGMSASTRVQLRTPESRAGPPDRLEVYWTRESYILRWSEPSLPNGDISHFVIKCLSDGEDLCSGNNSSETRTVLHLERGLYNISVAAVNNAGVGQFTEPRQPSTVQERPEPRIVLGQTYPSALLSIDIFSGRVSSSASFPWGIVLVQYLPWRDSYLVLTNQSRLMIVGTEREKYSELLQLEHEVRGLCVDTAGHYLYIAGQHSVSRIDLDSHSPVVQSVVHLAERLVKIDYDPGESRLLMLTQTGDKYEMVRSDISPHGQPTLPVSLDPSCCGNLSLSPDTFSLVPLQPSQMVLRDLSTGHIYLTDLKMCNCTKIGDSNKIKEDLILQSDLTNVYVMSRNTREIRSIDLLDFRVQELPLNSTNSFTFGAECGECGLVTDTSCLKLGPSAKPGLTNIQSESAELLLAPPLPLPGCTLSLPATRYNTTVRQETSGQTRLLQFVNQGNVKEYSVTLTDLIPDTEYVVTVMMFNVYMEGNTTDLLHQSARFRTRESSPTAPQNLTATVLSPYEVSVSWEEPALRRSEEVEYEVHWATDRVERKVVVGVGQTDLVLTDMMAGLDYSVWVVARSGTDKRSDEASVSDRVRLTMFHLPHNIQVQTQSRRMLVTWTAPDSRNVDKHFIQYFARKSHHGLEQDVHRVNLSVQEVTRPRQQFSYELKNLNPGSCYIVKVVVMYVTGGDWFEYPGDSSQCHFTGPDVPPVPGVPYISTRAEGMAVTWQEATGKEEAVSFELQQRRNVSHSWDTIYTDQENFHFLTTFQSGNESESDTF